MAPLPAISSLSLVYHQGQFHTVTAHGHIGPPVNETSLNVGSIHLELNAPAAQVTLYDQGTSFASGAHRVKELHGLEIQPGGFIHHLPLVHFPTPVPPRAHQH